MTTETTQLLGASATLYGLGGALSVLLQARRMHVRGTSGDVSARFFAVYVGGFAVWLLYGLGIGDVRSSWSTRWAFCAAPSRWRSR
jgi:membrane associated rhomboid family serine protease